MPPQQTPPSNPYEFITNPSTPVNGGARKFSMGSDPKKAVILIVVGGLILLVAVFVLYKLIFPTNNGNLPYLTTAAQTQSELKHISTDAPNQATSQTTKNIALTINLTMTTAQSQLLNQLHKEGRSISKATLTATQSLSTDSQLKSAQSVSNYDAVYLQVTQQQLNIYQKYLKLALDNSTSRSEKILLINDINGAALLATQVNNAISNPTQ